MDLALGHADEWPPYLPEEDTDVVGDSKRDLGRREEEDKKQLVADTDMEVVVDRPVEPDHSTAEEGDEEEQKQQQDIVEVD